AGGGDRGVQRAAAARLRSRRSASDVFRGDLRDRGEPELLSGAIGGVRPIRAGAWARPRRAGGSNRGAGVGAVLALTAGAAGGNAKEAGANAPASPLCDDEPTTCGARSSSRPSSERRPSSRPSSPTTYGPPSSRPSFEL